ncbi:MAG: tetratricopeptide repeat protein [Candidatus Eisenbacteria bacterium]|nr:tetratricopeptide repeat protein [Candidatus Eisenbacteria bacterium]
MWIPQAGTGTDAPERSVPLVRHLWRGVFLPLLLLAAVALVYTPVYRAEFIWDDDDYLLLNPLLTEEGGWAEIWDPSSPRNPQFYPLVFSSFRIERGLWGTDATGYHVVNVVLHALNVLLLLFLLRRLRVPGAWLVAGLFAVHPVFVESVAWISERKNVLSGFFYLLAAHSYLRFDATSRWRWYGLTLICFLGALFSKTITASLPLALGLALWWRGRRLRVSRFVTLLIMVAIGFALGMVTRLHEYQHVLSDGGGPIFAQLDPLKRILLAGRAFWFYPSKIVWPEELAFFYSRWSLDPRIVGQWIYPVAGLLVALLLVYGYRRGWLGRGPLAAALFYAVTIFPALGFVNVAPMRFSWVADHFQYLAAIGILLLIGGLWAQMRGGSRAGRARRGTAALVAIAILVLLGWRAQTQAHVYQDLGSLWADTAAKTPDSWIVQLNRGVWLKQHGDLEGAAHCYQRAAELDPPPGEGGIMGYGNLSSVCFVQGRYEESVRFARAVLAAQPGYPLALYNLGRSLWRLGRYAEAEPPLRALLEQKPDPAAGRAAWDFRRRLSDDRIWYVLGEVQAAQGKIDEALRSYGRALALAPNEPTLHLARLRLLRRSDRITATIAALREALTVLPAPQRAAHKLELGFLLATAADPTLRDGREALRIARELAGQLGARNPYILSVQAAAQAAMGRFQEAATSVEQALELAPQAQDPGLENRLHAQQSRYARRRLFHPLR